MKNIYKNFVKIIFSFSLFLVVSISFAQGVSISTSTSGGSKACSDCCDGDCTDGNIGDAIWRNEDFSLTGTRYCAGSGTVEVRLCDDDGALGIQSCDGSCEKTRTANYTVAPGASNPQSGTLDFGTTGTTCGGTRNWSVSWSGTWPGNAASSGGITNGSCASAYDISPDNASGGNQLGTDHTMDCGDPTWYKYTLTSTNVTRLEFTGNKNTGDLVAYTDIDQVYFAGCSCSLPDAGGGGDFAIENPAPGDYYFRVTENLGNITLFDVNITKSTGTKPANDLIQCATTITLNYCGNPTGSGNNANAYIEKGTGCSNEPRKDEDRTVWYKWTSPADIGTRLRIRVNNAGGDNMTPDIRLYELNDNAYSFGTCGSTTQPNWSKLTQVGADDGTYLTDDDAEINLYSCGSTPIYKPSTTYYLQVNDEGNTLGVGYDGGNFNYYIRDNGAEEGPNAICSAYDMGTYTSTIPACTPKYQRTDATTAGVLDKNDMFRINRESNYCSNGESGEPNSPNKTNWYKFTTGGTVGNSVTVTVDATDLNGSGSGLDAFVGVYQSCAAACPTFAQLTEIGTGGSYSVGGGPDDASFSFKPIPNTTYYVQVDGYSPVVGVGGGESGEYSLIVQMSNANPTPSNDFVCSATDKGTLALGGSLSHSNFTNIGATSEDLCNANEPNVDENDETVWFKFKSSATPGTQITVDASAIGGTGTGGACVLGEIVAAWTKVYEGPDNLTCPFDYKGANPFTVLTGVGSSGIDVSDVDIECPKPNQTYYVQIDMGGLATCDMGNFNLTITDNGKSAGPDKICNALDIGVATYGGPLSNNTNTDLYIANQSTQCATVGSGEPDQMTGSLDRTVWYKFKTPTSTSANLPHTYQVEVSKASGSNIDAFPVFSLWKDNTGTGTRTCGGAGGTENATSFANLTHVDSDNGFDITNSDANLDFMCLEPDTWYYIQVDATGLFSDWVNFNIRVKKDAFRPADNICDATDLGYITSNGLASGTTTNVNWTLSSKFTAAPYFGLPHTNKCSSAEPGEPSSSPGGPDIFEPYDGTYTGTVWYRFTTGSGTPPDWIYWYNDDDVLGGGRRGSLCVLGTTFNSEVSFYKNISTAACPVGTNLELQDEMNIPGDLCDHTTGIGFGAPCYNDMFRLKCPQANTTYYVQVKDAGAISTCFEGQWSFDNSNHKISTAAGLGGPPPNDSICYALDIGTVPNGGTLIPSNNIGNGPGLFDNFCATPDVPWRADFNQPLDRDVWFKFKPPLSGSVLITAQSAPAGSPGVDDDLDIQMAVWEPILGDGTNNHCSDPRYLWTPIIAQDHGIQEELEAGGISTTYYDIYNTCGNSVLCNEGNSLIATCLDPNKYYYIQVDGGDYLGCDLIDAGDCIMGYFKMQLQDANLGLINPDNTATNISPYTAPAVRNFEYLHDEPCFAYRLNVQGTGVAYGSLNWTRMTNRCATSISDPLPAEWQAKNASTDKTVWASFIAPASGSVKIRTENISQIKGDADYHEAINLQLALYTTDRTCFDKNTLYEVGRGNGFDGLVAENDPTNDDDYVGLATDGFDEYYVAKCLIPGKEYFIMIDGDQGYVAFANVEDVEGDFRISVQDEGGVPASLNDDICDAYDMEANPSGGKIPSTMAVNAVYTTPIAFNNECATIQDFEGPGQVAENIDGLLSDFDVEHTLWFKFKAPASGKVKIEGLNDGTDNLDIGLALYDLINENCANRMTAYSIAEDYDPTLTGSVGSLDDEEITISCLTPGRYYYLQVDGDKNLSCGPLTGDVGSDCETGQFKVRITHLPAEPTYTTNVAYSSPAGSLPSDNDAMCNAHPVRNASGTYNPLNAATFLNPGETITFHHNNRCATSENGEPEANGWDLNPFDPDGDPTVWYAFQTGPSLGALRPGDITIELNNPTGVCFDPDLDLYEFDGTMAQALACPSKFGKLLRVGEGITSGLFTPREEGIEITCPKPNKVYLLRVLGTSTCPLFGDDQGEYDITIAMGAINIDFQTNDNICGVTNMGTLASGATLSQNNQNNLCATQEINEPNTTQSAVQNEPEYDETVWYKFRTSANPGAIEVYCEHIASPGIAAIPSITVYRYMPSGNPCSTDPFNNLADLDSDMGAAVAGVVTVSNATVILPCVKPNTDYYIQVDGADLSLWGFTIPGFTDNFYFNLRVTDLGAGTSRPVNDDLNQAIPADGTKNAPDPSLLPAGGTITVSGHNICATCQNGEDGDYCGNDQTAHTASFDAEDETVWYYFTTSATPGIINVRVQDDPAVAGNFSPNFTLYYNNGNNPIFRVTQAPNAKLIKEGSTSTAISTTTNQNYTCLLPNTKYYIQVDGNDALTDQGYFIVTVTDDNSGNPGPTTPTNYDLICSANQITVPNNNTTGWLPRTNKCSWEEAGEPNTSNNMGGTGDDVTSNDYDETVWFTFVPGVTGDITLDIDPTAGLAGGVNYVLYEMPSTSTITCSGDVPTWSQLTEISSGSALVGITLTETFPCLSNAKRYYLQIDGNDLVGAVDVGDFNLRLTHASHVNEVNDNICGIGGTVALGNLGTFTTSATRTTTNQDNRCATQEVGEPGVNGPYDDITDAGYDHTLWYKFVASNTDGTYNISVTNVGSDQINAYIGLYRADGTVCSGVTPNFNNLTLIQETPSVNSVTNNETMSLECWEIEEGATYYIQVQGFDAIGGGDVGDNFSVAVQFTSSSTNPADNICTAPTANIGTTYTADNRCATTQTGEPNISPSPQDPSDGSAYDETLWYKFVAPASGEVRLNLSNFSVPLLLSVNATLYETPSGYNCATNVFTGLIPNESSSFLTSALGTMDFRCLSPGKTYYIQFDGNDLLTDRGTWDFVLTDLAAPAGAAPANDEPCGAIDVTQYVRTDAQGPCTNDGQYYTNSYSIYDGSPDIDRATKTATAIGCDGELNCNDYWFKFEVPADATGIRIQGNDEYSAVLGNNSDQHIGLYRAPSGCNGPLVRVNCGSGGFTDDVDMTAAVYPGEVLYLQVFNADPPGNPSRPVFGFCISVDCPPKLPCGGTDLVYNQSQCWNMNTNSVNYSPFYYDCLPGSNNSANYFTFHTDCDGTPYDTVQVIFSVTTLGCGATAMSIVQDNTPCPTAGGYDQIILNCAVFEEVTGGTTATNFNQTYVLPGCATYVMQIISSENDASCASNGQVIFVRGSNPTTVLPIELLSFTGYNNGEFNVLNWTTASEINSNRFEVEKSLDAATFETIGTVAAAGNSSELLDYSFNDVNPVMGNNYYRLKMYDNDGSYKYSEVINIKLQANPTAKQDGIVKIYPNPTNGMLNIQYQSSVETDMNLRVFNVIGQTMLDEVKSVNPGMNIITVNAFEFAKGMYLINLLDANSDNSKEIHQAKFIKE